MFFIHGPIYPRARWLGVGPNQGRVPMAAADISVPTTTSMVGKNLTVLSTSKCMTVAAMPVLTTRLKKRSSGEVKEFESNKLAIQFLKVGPNEYYQQWKKVRAAPFVRNGAQLRTIPAYYPRPPC